MKLETLLKLLIEEKQSNSIEYALMSQSEKLANYDFISYAIPDDIVILVEIDSKYVRTNYIQICRHVSDDDTNTYSDVLVIQNAEMPDNPETFALDQQLPIKLFQLYNLK